MRTDEELVMLCREGDSSAYKELINRYKGLIYSIPLRKFRFSQFKADEVFSDVTNVLMKNISTRFKLTEQSFINLKEENIPEETLEKLKYLKNHEDMNEKKFIETVEKAIGQVETVRYKSLILKHANISKIESPDKIKSWLATVTKNKCLEYLRRYKKFASESIEVFSQKQNALDSASIEEKRFEDGDEVVEEEQLLKNVYCALRKLDESCRELIIGLFFEEKKYPEIADQLGLAEGSIGSKRKRCLEKMEEILKEMGLDKSDFF